MATLVPGMKVRYLPQSEWGVGHLVALHDSGSKAEVLFPAREGGPVLVSTKGQSLQPHQLSVGDLIKTAKGRTGAVTGEEPGGRGLRRYAVKFDDGEEDELPESELRAQPPRPDLLSTLREGRVADARNFLLRRRALLLDDERRCDALGALLASRVMVKPHQVGVVQRVLSARRPRFVLADEVGLGKTIEAGMIFSALRLSGLANRVLVVTPSHLSVQWLAELFHKFNQLFTLMDSDRYAASLKEVPDKSPWARFDRVVTSLELLSRTEEYVEQVADPAAAWDLVIIDEAHHLKSDLAFKAAKKLSQNTWGLLLLTATPMQLDPEEYHGLLTLIDPATAPTLDGLKQRLQRQEEVSEAVQKLLSGGEATTAVSALQKRFASDDQLAKLAKDRGALLSHLAETYSLSERLIRNRRAVVGGFAERRLHRHKVALADKEVALRAAAIKALGEKGQVRGAALSQLLRRLESSTAAARAFKDELPTVDRDGKLLAFFDVLRGIWAKEKAAKVLVFTESRETLDMLKDELLREKIEPLVYHGDLPLVDRDRQVARFRDPDGPKVMVCTEVGGEGRNFQFAHHLVNYDLPWSPAVMEQRIGRLDRIGQTQAVEIHVFEQPGTISFDVLEVLADSVGVFGETVGGLDAVLEEVEPSLTELALAAPAKRAAYAKALKLKVQKARTQVTHAYDPLLDRRSFDREAVEALVTRAKARFGLDDEDDALEEGLWSIARDLDERLEDAVTELARKIGVGVDTDEQVDAFQCAFHFGHAVNVDALPGLNIAEERTVLGTFWRDTAVEQEEIEYFATGHAIVEALFGFLRDGPYGRNGMRFLERRGPLKARGLEVLFHVLAPDPADTSVGARVPSRQLSRFLDRQLIRVAVALGPTGKPKVDASLLGHLEDEGRPLKGDEIRAAFPELANFVDPAIAEAMRAASAELGALADAAKKAIEGERDDLVRRMKLSLAHQGLGEAAISKQVATEHSHYESLLEALGQLRLELDSACAFVINR